MFVCPYAARYIPDSFAPVLQAFYRRILVLRYFINRNLLPVRETYEALGAEGMSSDEEDLALTTTAGVPTYVVYKPKQLSAVMAELAEDLDKIYLGTIKARHPHGSHIHRRVRTGGESRKKRKFYGLPRNAYDPAWLASLSHFERKQLAMGPDVDFDVVKALLPTEL